MMYGFNGIDKRFFPSLSRVYSPIVINNLMETGKSDYLSEVVHNSNILNFFDGSLSLRKFYDNLYSFLSVNYCNEYIFKNVIATQIYLGKHFEDSHMLTEFRVADCKADVVILNGTSTVYEIKSELDTFDRLDNQIDAYLNVFDHIFVITSKSQENKLKNRLQSEIGILILDSKNQIKKIRDSQTNKKNVIPSIIFDSLRKHEYTKIIKEYFDLDPKVPNTQIYKVCKSLFCELTPEKAHDAMLSVLKNRDHKLLKDYIDNVPESLKAYFLNTCTSEDNLNKFTNLLNNSLRSVLSPIV